MGARPKEDSVGAVKLLALTDEVGKSCGEGCTMSASVGSSGYKRPPLDWNSAKAAMIAKFINLGSSEREAVTTHFQGSGSLKELNPRTPKISSITTTDVTSFVALYIKILCLDPE